MASRALAHEGLKPTGEANGLKGLEREGLHRLDVSAHGMKTPELTRDFQVQGAHCVRLGEVHCHVFQCTQWAQSLSRAKGHTAGWRTLSVVVVTQPLTSSEMSYHP